MEESTVLCLIMGCTSMLLNIALCLNSCGVAVRSAFIALQWRSCVARGTYCVLTLVNPKVKLCMCSLERMHIEFKQIRLV